MVLATSVIGSNAFAAPAIQAVVVTFTRLSVADETCPAVYSVALYSANFFEGNVSLTVANLPNTVSVRFNPNQVFIPASGDANTIMMVMGSPDTPKGNFTLTLKLLPPSTRIVGNDSSVTVPIGPCIGNPSVKNITTTTTTTTTVVYTSTVTSVSAITSVSMAVTTERVTDPSTYAWAVSATVATVMLAVVLMLQRRTKK